MIDNQRNHGAKIAGVQVFGSEVESVHHIRPKRVIFHLTEDRAPTSPSIYLGHKIKKRVMALLVHNKTRWVGLSAEAECQGHPQSGQVTQ
jgi:hypothetical protein